MKNISIIFIAIVLIVTTISAKESEAKKLCDAEVKKEQPSKIILEEQCSIVAEEYEKNKKFERASWYYLLARKNTYNIQTIKSKISETGNIANIAHSYVLENNFKEAKIFYTRFLNFFSIPWVDEAIQDDFKLLFKLYPKNNEQINQGLALWNEIYKPLIEINTLYTQYKEARKEKKYKSAIDAISKVITLQKSFKLQSKLLIVDNLFSLGIMLNENKKYTEAIKNLQEVEKVYKDEDNRQISLGYVLGWIADSYKHLQKNTEALGYHKKSLSIKEKILGKEHQSTASSYNSIGLLYQNMGDYPQALSYYQKSLAISEKVLGKEHPDTARSYNNMGSLYQDMGDYTKALSYYEKVLNILEKVLGKEHSGTAISYNNMGSLYQNMGDYTKALSYYQKSLTIREKILGKEHQSTASSYNSIGLLYQNMGDYPQALSYYQKSLAIREKLLGKEHPDTATSYNNMGLLYQNMSDYRKALSYYQKSLSISEKILGKEHSDTAKSYNNMGSLYQNMGDYPQALSYYQKSLAIREKLLGKGHPDTAKSYNNMGSLYRNMGDYPQALSYYQKSLSISEKILGKEHSDTAKSYNNMGLLYQNMGDYTKALSYYQKSLSISEKILGKEHSDTAISYNNIGLLYQKMGDYPQALSYHQKSLAIREKLLGKGHPDTAQSYNNMGLLYKSMVCSPKALSYYQKSLSISEKILGKGHPDTAKSYNNIGSLYRLMKDYSKAYVYVKKAFNNFILNRDKNFQILDNKQKKLYLQDNSEKLSFMLNTAYIHKETNITKEKTNSVNQESFNSWLSYKGSIFDSENAIATLHANTKDTKLKKKIDNLISNKRYLAKLYQFLPKPIEREAWKKNIKNTEEKISTLTNEISSKAESFKESQGFKSINYKNISSNLKENELYIDYAKAGEYYFVFSIDNKEHITFTHIDKNRMKQIDTLVKTFREDVTSILDDESITDERLKVLTSASKEKLSKLYELVLSKPLYKELKNKQNLIISPDGALRLLPFEAMFDKENGKYLIEQKEIRYIPSGKELIRLYKYGKNKVFKHETKNTVIFSNPNFDAKDVTNVASVDNDIAITPNTSRAGIIKSLFRMRFSPLPGTKDEAASIKETLKDEKLTEYKQEEANEANLMKVKEPNILHIATHGFFINDNTIPNPMLKSGIALSGANASAIRGKSDGIVTALKLSGLKLKGTDLVVLSACQTGVVDVNSTDSVSGLSKAFIQAGAKDIVMSLWSVDDQATKDLMSSFYKEMQNYPSYAKALKVAKLKMIEQGMHPFYWAPFVVSGL